MALKIPQPLHSFIPRKRDTFEFTIPEFHPMASAEPPPPPPPPASNVVAPSAEFFAERWDAGRRENLVMVFNADGRIFAVSRAALMKSRNDREVSPFIYLLRCATRPNSVHSQITKYATKLLLLCSNSPHL